MGICGYVTAACVAFAGLAAMTGCISGVESIAADVSPEGWSKPVGMLYSNTDTLTAKELQLTLRHSANYGSLDGRYVVKTASPSGVLRYDTLAIGSFQKTQGNKLAEARAQPVSVNLSEHGDYSFTVTPLQEVRNVWNVAIELKQPLKHDGQR